MILQLSVHGIGAGGILNRCAEDPGGRQGEGVGMGGTEVWI